MRGFIQYFFFSGQAWFAAGALFVLAIMVDLARVTKLHRVAHFLLVLAILLGALSGTPLPWWLTIPLIVMSLCYAVRYGRGNLAIAGMTALVVVAALIHEALFFFARPAPASRPSQIIVIGDSLSSGGFGESSPWPQLLARSSGIAVENLSQPAETTATALLYQAPRLKQSAAPGELVIVEIGGNDLLGGTPASTFARDLDQLLALAREGGAREVLMFELPLLPGKWMYGAHQRRLARRYGTKMVPKRFLAKLLMADENVFDGLHLTQSGHERLAAEVRRWLEP